MTERTAWPQGAERKKWKITKHMTIWLEINIDLKLRLPRLSIKVTISFSIKITNRDF